MRGRVAHWRSDERGSTAVEMALLSGIMVMVTAGAVEAGFAYHQHGNAQHAVRHGARLAALGDPVSVLAAETSGRFTVECFGDTQRCSRGGFDAAAFQRLYSGADGDNACGQTTRDRQGMCDVMEALDADDLVVRYSREREGEHALVTVTVRQRPLRTVAYGPLLPQTFRTLPSVSATMTGGDLDG